MKIKTCKGNLLTFPCGINIIFQGCNIENTFGAGIAKQIKEQIPEMYRADTEAYKANPQELLGGFSYARFERENKIIYGYNLYQQSLLKISKYNIPLDYDALRSALTKARDHIKLTESYEKDFTPVVGVPMYMGCGLAGGDWVFVYSMIKEIFKQTDYKFVFVEYNNQ